MLHPRVRRHDKIAREPRAQKNQERRHPVSDSPEFFLAEQEQAQEARFEKKRKHAFHRQRLPDHSARGLRKRSPVRPELKFHRNTRNHTERKIDPENPRPESRRAIVMFIAGAQRFGLQVDEQTKALRTGDEHYNRAARFWARIFGINFALGVVTGIPMEFQFGTNWAAFSK